MSAITTATVIEAVKSVASAYARFAQRWTRIKRKGCPVCGSSMELVNYWKYKVVFATKAVCVSCGHEIVRSK